MTTTTLKTFVREPFDLALGQPHQFLISAASVAIVSAEAATLVPFPLNISLAVGAEWAYLRGLISGAGIKSRWSAALNTSAFLLVVLYGALWGFRGFHLIPDTPDPWLAIVLTIIHIGAIGAVTLCSAMLHRAGESVKAEQHRIAVALEDERNRRNQEIEDARNQEWRRAQLELEIEKQRQQAALAIETERARLRAEARAAARAATAPQVARNQARNPVIVDGVEYPSIQAAADAHGISRQAMAKRLKREA